VVALEKKSFKHLFANHQEVLYIKQLVYFVYVRVLWRLAAGRFGVNSVREIVTAYSVTELHCHLQGAFLVPSDRCSIEEQSIEYCGWECCVY
jgi:hypothetical protein